MNLYAIQKKNGGIIYVRAESSKDVHNAYAGIGFRKNPYGIVAVFKVKPTLPKAEKIIAQKTCEDRTVFNSHQFLYSD